MPMAGGDPILTIFAEQKVLEGKQHYRLCQRSLEFACACPLIYSSLWLRQKSLPYSTKTWACADWEILCDSTFRTPCAYLKEYMLMIDSALKIKLITFFHFLHLYLPFRSSTGFSSKLSYAYMWCVSQNPMTEPVTVTWSAEQSSQQMKRFVKSFCLFICFIHYLGL